MSHLAALIGQHKASGTTGIYAVCSAHPLVLEAACRQAVADRSPLLVEATSNQVDQFGGYTGLIPADFRRFVEAVAQRVGLPHDRVVLGGDHLGPNRWRDQPAEQAMRLAEHLVAEYARAGFSKIHLDCSMACADDTGPPTDEVVARRSARLAGVAERAAAASGLPAPHYVVGTEVPVPGGAAETIEALVPTEATAVKSTIAAHEDAFAAAGLANAWTRVVGVVAQPGVEFDHLQVIDYRPESAAELGAVLADDPRRVFEAHSTDYQTVHSLRSLVREHFAILKVGPALTFALREVLYALAAIESEIVAPDHSSRLVEVVEQRMLHEPEPWRAYYHGSAAEQRLARHYSFSDRVRYYWPDAEVQAAVSTLRRNLDARRVPLPLLSQHLPRQFQRVREHGLPTDTSSLVVDGVRDVLGSYASACGMQS